MRRAVQAVLGVAVIVAFPSAALAGGARPFGHACTVESGGVRFCPTPAPTTSSDQRPRSWDGAPMQVDVTLPPTGDGPWPTIVMLPGYGGSDGVSWETASTAYGSHGGDFFNAEGLAEQGYAIVTMNFRGVGYSCGPPYPGSDNTDVARTADPAACRNVSFEFADQRYDARDVQSMLGLLVDEGIAEPRGLGVIGGSLGSLVTNELALLYNRVRLLDGRFRPWRSPAGIPLHIAAAYSTWSLSSFMDAIAPNGHFLSFEPNTATNDYQPLGAIKFSVPIGIAGEAPVDTWTIPSKPGGFDTFADGVYGELAAPDGPGLAALVRQIHDYHQSVGMPLGSDVAPILTEDGWGDLLVNGVSQAYRLVDYLKRAAPHASVAVQLSDNGHPLAMNKASDYVALDNQALAFFNHYLQGAPGGPAPGSVTAWAATCPGGAPSSGPYKASGLDALTSGAVRFSSPISQTVVGGGDPSIGAQLDPIFNTGAESTMGTDPQCQTHKPVNMPGTAVYTYPVTEAFTTLGLPTMRMRVATIGDSGQLDARLWDVAPDGSETYVSRGTYALANNQTGTITWQMWGAGHTFPKGDTIRVELLAQDAPLERPAPRPFAVSVSDFTIELPSHESPDGGEIVAPVLARPR